MIKFPLIILFAIIAFNVTVFAVMLQMDWLIFHALILKIIAWVAAAGAWYLTYVNRNKTYTFMSK